LKHIKIFLFLIISFSTNFAENFQIDSTTDYIIVTPEIFLAEAESLATYRKLSTLDDVYNPSIVTTENIYSIYKNSFDTVDNPKARSIRTFLRNKINSNTNIKYIVLIGKGYLEGLGRTEPNFIPSITDGFILSNGEKRVSDDLFTSEKWGIKDIFPISIISGRFSIKNKAQFYNIFNKIKKYESSREAWKTKITFSADDDKNYAKDAPEKDQVPDYICHECYSENYLSCNVPQYMNQNKVYMQMYDLAEDNYQRPGATTALINAMNGGNLAVTFVGHGWSQGWAYEEFLRKSNLKQLTNTNPFLLISLSCATGDYMVLDGDSTAITEEINTIEYGSVVSIASANETLGLKNVLLGMEIFKTLFSDSSNKSVGKLLLDAKNLKASDANYAPYSSTYLIFGDPATVITIPLKNINISDTIDNNLEYTNSTSQTLITTLDDSIQYDRNSNSEEYRHFKCKIWGKTILDTISSSNELQLNKLDIEDGYYKLITTLNIDGTTNINIIDSVYIKSDYATTKTISFSSDKFNVFPNPIKDKFSVTIKDFDNSKSYNLKIIGLNGIEIQSFHLNNNLTSFSNINILTGTYIAEITKMGKRIDRVLIYIKN